MMRRANEKGRDVRQVEREPRNIGRETLSGQDTETPVLSPPLMGPEVGLAGRGGEGGVLKYIQPAGLGKAGRRPGLPGRVGGAGAQLHLQERTIMLDSCSTLGLRPT